MCLVALGLWRAAALASYHWPGFAGDLEKALATLEGGTSSSQGNDGRTLFIPARNSLYAVQVRFKGR